MIRKISASEFAICYDSSPSQVFEGGFQTAEAAHNRFWNMKPVDRMLVTGKGPYLQTDVEFLAGSENGRQFQDRPDHGDHYAKIAKRHGQNVKGKKYLSQLARFPGDPEAFVSSRGDVQKVLEQRGWGCDGTVKVKAAPRGEAPKPVDIAEDIVDRETSKQVMPGMKPRERLDLREKVKAKLKGNHKK